MALTKTERRNRIKLRIKRVIKGTTQTPRLTVFRSNKQMYAQIVDDLQGKTLAYASSRCKDYAAEKCSKLNQAQEVGKLIAKKAQEVGINNVVFDRNGYLYHGRVKALAEAAREAGLKF